MGGGFSNQGQERHQPRRRSGMGHLERFRSERVSGRYQIGQGTSAGAYSGDGLAPDAVILSPNCAIYRLLGVPSLAMYVVMSAALAISGVLVLILIIALQQPVPRRFSGVDLRV